MNMKMNKINRKEKKKKIFFKKIKNEKKMNINYQKKKKIKKYTNIQNQNLQ